MRSVSIVIVGVLACVAVVSAKRLPVVQEELELEAGAGVGGGFGGPFPGEGGFFRGSPFGGVSDEVLFEELRLRGHGPLLRGGKGFGGRRRRPPFGPGPVRPPIAGGIAGAGAAGALEASNTKLGAVGAHNHVGSHGLIEGQKGSLVAGGKVLDVGAHNDLVHETDGIHKHSLINNDKTFIRDRTTGVEDLDTFHNRDGISQGGHLTSASGALAAQQAGGRIESGKELDSDFGAIGASNSQLGAAGAAGAVGAGGVL